MFKVTPHAMQFIKNKENAEVKSLVAVILRIFLELKFIHLFIYKFCL